MKSTYNLLLGAAIAITISTVGMARPRHDVRGPHRPFDNPDKPVKVSADLKNRANTDEFRGLPEEMMVPGVLENRLYDVDQMPNGGLYLEPWQISIDDRPGAAPVRARDHVNRPAK